MINYTSDCYEMKRECVKFAENLTKGCSKPTRGFVMDMIYGISASKDIKITSISRKLKESEQGTKLENTIERLCRQLDSELGTWHLNADMLSGEEFLRSRPLRLRRNRESL